MPREKKKKKKEEDNVTSTSPLKARLGPDTEAHVTCLMAAILYAGNRAQDVRENNPEFYIRKADGLIQAYYKLKE